MQAGHRAEQVLHRPGKAHHAVGFQLAQVDEVIPLQEGLRHRELAAAPCPGQGDLPAFAFGVQGKAAVLAMSV